MDMSPVDEILKKLRDIEELRRRYLDQARAKYEASVNDIEGWYRDEVARIRTSRKAEG